MMMRKLHKSVSTLDFMDTTEYTEPLVSERGSSSCFLVYFQKRAARKEATFYQKKFLFLLIEILNDIIASNTTFTICNVFFLFVPKAD